MIASCIHLIHAYSNFQNKYEVGKPSTAYHAPELDRHARHVLDDNAAAAHGGGDDLPVRERDAVHDVDGLPGQGRVYVRTQISISDDKVHLNC
jgi:hypothetical protein